MYYDGDGYKPNQSVLQCVCVHYTIGRGNDLKLYVSDVDVPISGKLVDASDGFDLDGQLYAELSHGTYHIILEGTLGDISTDLYISRIDINGGQCSHTFQGMNITI